MAAHLCATGHGLRNTALEICLSSHIFLVRGQASDEKGIMTLNTLIEIEKFAFFGMEEVFVTPCFDLKIDICYSLKIEPR